MENSLAKSASPNILISILVGLVVIPSYSFGRLEKTNGYGTALPEKSVDVALEKGEEEDNGIKEMEEDKKNEEKVETEKMDEDQLVEEDKESKEVESDAKEEPKTDAMEEDATKVEENKDEANKKVYELKEEAEEQEEKAEEENKEKDEESEEEKGSKKRGKVQKTGEKVKGKAKKSEDKEPEQRTPLTDRPVRERKSVERLVASIEKDVSREFQIEKGKGTPLKDIPNVAFKLSRRKTDDTFRLLHTVLFGRRGKDYRLASKHKQFIVLHACMSTGMSHCKEIILGWLFRLRVYFQIFWFLWHDNESSKGKKRKRATNSGTTSTRTTKSRKKSEDTSKSGKKNTPDSEDESEEDEEEEREEEEEKEEEQNEEERKENGVAENLRTRCPRILKESAGKAKTKKVITPKRSTPQKRTPKTSSTKNSTADDDSDESPKVSSRKKPEKVTKEKSTTPTKSASKEKTSKRVGKGKDKAKEQKLKPSDHELRDTICKILKEVDFNTATFTDILKLLAQHFNTDLTARKSSIKLMIQEELTKLAEEAGDEDEEGDAEKDETQSAGQEVQA
ncbi:DEK domain-containing chromatin associated protein isoform 2 [Hibiscus syriacus]|uniref:DEK domain-containing chromatin associated protein isoform 2 n=1 Tax=Hibiscus syriacus TaxID=106335 RepID=A0A6A2XIA0_HIBSY|nr:DEK domain-containing chromatin associated protein isoform 2 [Hibiscus syriacus]